MGLEQLLDRLGLTQDDIATGETLGGFDLEDWEFDEDFTNLQYFDKGGHKERSLSNQPRHKKFWKVNK